MTEEILKNDKTLKALRYQLGWMKWMSRPGPKVVFRSPKGEEREMPYPEESRESSEARATMLADWIERRTFCLSNHLSHNCDCIQKRVAELINNKEADRLFRVVEESEGPLKCEQAVQTPGRPKVSPPEGCTVSIPVGDKVAAYIPHGGDDVTECEPCFRKYLAEYYQDHNLFEKDSVIQVIKGIEE